MMAARAVAVTAESPRSHSVYVSHPETVAAVIDQAAQALAEPVAAQPLPA